MNAPLAEILRPDSAAELKGQQDILGANRIISSLLEKKKLCSLIFWGPPGCGKTSLSRILVNTLDYPAQEFSATVSGIGEIRKIMKDAAQIKALHQKPLVVFVDEIHHFNKSSQDAFLPFVEKGDIILIGTTTENPAYKINRALLSRLKILEFKPLDKADLREILKKGAEHISKSKEFSLTEDAEETVLAYSNGDARRMLNLLDLLSTIKTDSQITDKNIHEIIKHQAKGYSRTGDDRYILISAFHKSVRNSDIDSTLFWLEKMLSQGEDPIYILRRMVRISGEDIGLADPKALEICLNAKKAFEFLGTPEGETFLIQAAIYLATAPKSNSVYLAEKTLKKTVTKYSSAKVPLHLINPSNFISRSKGAGREYLYAHDFPQKTTPMQTLPDEITERDFYKPSNIGFEKKIAEKILYWRKTKESMKLK